MTETRLPRGSRVRLGTVEGDLRADANVQIEVDGRLVVSGEARFDGDVDIDGDLQCRSFLSEDGVVRIRGSLIADDSVHARDGALEVGGEFRARRVDVDRGLRVQGPATAEEFEVGGILQGSSTLHATKVSVGGRLHLTGRLTA
jgi:cytoskeletal protein CcmA (bactofilin family)